MLSFVKLEATGNDFVVVDDAVLPAHSGPLHPDAEASSHSEAALRAPAVAPTLPVSVRRRLCDRHTGIGGDGVLTILGRDGRYRMHITNPDGSVPEMCGNGLRCVARHLAETGRIPTLQRVVIDTDAGPRTVVVAAALDRVTIEMGSAAFVSPRQFPRPLSREPLHGFARATTVSMGNPHVVIEVDQLPTLEEATRFGRAIELDAALFPERTNVEWVLVGHVGPETFVEVIVWERGAGLTQACGTGACGVAAVLVKHGVVPPGTTRVSLPGGALDISVSDLDTPIFMEGPVKRVFAGVADV
ncbi:MAG: diaminopimelate epimerase [Deltaproteobacteria bacterium]|nr:diaminopimelate epimerase [Deltaproteobacteria bacterium]